MFEAAELGHEVPKAEYALREPILRAALLKAQYDLLANGKFPVIILIGGVDGAGNLPLARRSYCALSRAARSMGSRNAYSAFGTLCPNSAASNITNSFSVLLPKTTCCCNSLKGGSHPLEVACLVRPQNGAHYSRQACA